MGGSNLHDEYLRGVYPPPSNHPSPFTMFNPPHRELPMFQTNQPHHARDLTEDGKRRSSNTNTNTLVTGQVFEFGNRDYANYLHQHLGEYLKQADYDYRVMGLQSPNFGFSPEFVSRRNKGQDPQRALNETEILKQLRENNTDNSHESPSETFHEKTLVHESELTNDESEHKYKLKTMDKSNIYNNNTNNNIDVDSDKTENAGIRKHEIIRPLGHSYRHFHRMIHRRA